MVNVYLLKTDGGWIHCLAIPLEDIERLSLHPLKWLRFIIFTVSGAKGCNVCTPQAESTPRNPEAGSAYRLSPQSLVSKEAQNKLWGITTHIQAKGSKFP